MKRIPQSGEIYYHFKKKLCQIIAIAEHSETREQMVIYQALQGDYGIYAYPLELFVDEVDHEKYPDVTQNYRFTKVKMHEDGTFILLEESPEAQTKQPSGSMSERTSSESFKHTRKEAETADELLMKFLDAETMEEKYQVLVSMHDVITDRLIDNMAVVMDVVIPDGELVNRYDSLKYAVRTRQKYEYSNRLR